MLLDSATNEIRFVYRPTDHVTEAQVSVYATAMPFNASRTSHLAITLAANNIRFYLNGTLIHDDTVALPGIRDAPDAPLQLGRRLAS